MGVSVCVCTWVMGILFNKHFGSIYSKNGLWGQDEVYVCSTPVRSVIQCRNSEDLGCKSSIHSSEPATSLHPARLATLDRNMLSPIETMAVTLISLFNTWPFEP